MIDLISKGRASHVGLFKLLGYNIRYYEEHFDLLLQINEKEKLDWNGRFRASLKDAEILVFLQNGSLPIWRAGGHPASAVKAGKAGFPMGRLKRRST